MKQSKMLLFVCLLAACSRESPIVQKQSTVPPPPQKPWVSYYEGTHAADAIHEIHAKVGDPFRVLKISIDDDSVRMQVQDPKKRENVDEYRLTRGELQPPVPVRLIGQTRQETLEANLFDPADVDFTKIPDLIREANEKVQLEGRELSGITVDRDMFDDSRSIEIDVDYRGTRKSGYLRADRKGKVKKVNVY